MLFSETCLISISQKQIHTNIVILISRIKKKRKGKTELLSVELKKKKVTCLCMKLFSEILRENLFCIKETFCDEKLFGTNVFFIYFRSFYFFIHFTLQI